MLPAASSFIEYRSCLSEFGGWGSWKAGVAFLEAIKKQNLHNFEGLLVTDLMGVIKGHQVRPLLYTSFLCLPAALGCPSEV